MCGRELLKWRWRLTYLPCPQLHNMHSDSQDVLNMLFLCGVWISKRKEDASVDDSLGQEVKLCEKVMVLCEKKQNKTKKNTLSGGVLSYTNIFQLGLFPPLRANPSQLSRYC